MSRRNGVTAYRGMGVMGTLETRNQKLETATQSVANMLDQFLLQINITRFES